MVKIAITDTIAQLREILDDFKKDELDFALVYYEAIDSIGKQKKICTKLNI